MNVFYPKRIIILLSFLSLSLFSFAQSGGVQGKVVDDKNQILPGASVLVDGTTIGAQADQNGNYSITGLKPGSYSITAKFLGYISSKRNITIGNGMVVLNFALDGQNTSLNEIVVIGYGTATKKDLTGSITTVNAKDFNQGSITTPEQLIQGKVAGVSIISNGGAPGSGSQILIRGGASVNGSNDPLYVIDGVPLGEGGIAGVASPLSLINPNDIETFTILKDAQATAIYGNRGSNGVILITTKKGKPGKTKIDFNTNFSIGTLPKEASVLTADQFRTYIKQNDTTTSGIYRSQLGTANTDWQKQIYQNSFSNEDNISVSGAAGKLPYRISFGYTNQNGILKTSSLVRYSTTLNLSPSLFKDHLKINFNEIASEVNQRFANQGAIGSAVSFNPTLPVYSGNSNYGGFTEILSPTTTNPENLNTLAGKNPLGLLEQETNKSQVWRSISSLQLDYKLHFFPDIHANVNASLDASKGSGYDIIPASAASQYPGSADSAGVIQRGNNSKYKSVRANTSFDGYLTYNHFFKPINTQVTATAGYSTQTFQTTSTNYLSYFSNGEFKPGSVYNYPTDIQKSELASFYGRLILNYDEKLILSGSIRQDVSTKFAPGIRTGYFPAGSLAWVVSNENFLKDSKVLSFLKIRVGYGKTGNQQGIGNYDYLSPYSLGNRAAEYEFGNGTYYQVYRPGAFYPNRTWESTATTNAAIDYGFLNRRITGSVDFYYRKTDKLLATINEPAGSNFSNQIVANVGNMEDKGIEFSINADIIRSTNYNWSVGFNATLNRNKITNLTAVTTPNFPGLPTGGISGGIGTTIQINQVGYAKYSFYTLQQVYGSNGKPLDGVFVDKNKDGIINSQDLSLNQSPDPQEYLGLNSDFRYKKWDIGFSARASFGNYVYNNVASSTGFKSNFLNPITVFNGSSSVLATGFSGLNSSNEYLSDYYIENASFLRLDNAHLGYNLGKLFGGGTNLRVNASVQNVFTVTKYSGLDPEVTSGIDNNLYPRPRTYLLGLSLSL